MIWRYQMRVEQLAYFGFDDIESVINNASSSKCEFMTFISRCTDNLMFYSKIDNVVINDSDVLKWFHFFNGGLEAADIENTTRKYLISKNNEEKIDLSAFLSMCSTDVGHGLESLFRRKCSHWSIDRLIERIHKEELSLERVFEIHEADPYYDNLSKIVRTEW